MGYTGIETVVEAVALEVYVFGHPVIEGVVGEIVTIQFSGKIWIPDVVDLGDSRKVGGLASGVRRFCCGYYDVSSFCVTLKGLLYKLLFNGNGTNGKL